MLPLLGALFQPTLPSAGALRVGGGYPGLVNASVSVYALHPFELELGTEGSLGHRGLTARAGPALGLYDRRNELGQGLTVHAPMLVGYRLLDFGRDAPAHSLTLNPTLTAALWLKPRLALEIQATMGVGFTLSDPSGGVGRVATPDGRLQVGLAF